MRRWILDAFTVNGKTETAGTVITALVPPHTRGVSRITQIVWICGSTAHDVILMKPIGVTTVTTAVAASGTEIILTTASPGVDSSGDAEALAANDYVAWRATDGTVEYDTVASVSSNTVTVNNGTTPGIAANAKFWAFYEVGRTVPHKTLKCKASTVHYWESEYGIFSGEGRTWEDPDNYASNASGIDRPLLVYCANATAASTLSHLNGVWTTN